MDIHPSGERLTQDGRLRVRSAAAPDPNAAAVRRGNLAFARRQLYDGTPVPALTDTVFEEVTLSSYFRFEAGSSEAPAPLGAPVPAPFGAPAAAASLSSVMHVGAGSD